MDGSRRRLLVGTLVAVGVAGCLEGDGTGSAVGDEPALDASDGTPAEGGTTDGTTPRDTPEGTGSTPADGPDVTPEVFPGYEMTEVSVQTPDGDELGRVRAAIADTQDLRYTGLSDTDSLPEHYGMLFVFDDTGERTFVMREMDFGIDIVYADEDGIITSIHHAPEPGPDEDGSEQRYPGRGQYVLEVNRHWTTERGIEEGDVLDFDCRP